MNWRLRAACTEENPALFFAADREPPLRRQVREERAKAVCASCPVIDTCLEFRLGFREQRDDAIWAGLDGDERTALRHAWVKRQLRRREAA